jgi:hypothetical protein
MILIEDSIKFYNNNINSLQRYDIAQHYKILHNVVQRLSQHSITIWNHCHIQKPRQRKIMIQIKHVGLSMIFHCKDICQNIMVHALSP